MMKMTSRLLLVLISIVVLLPATASAAANNSANFCEVLSSRHQQISDNLSKRRNAFVSSLNEAAENIDNRRADAHTKVEEARNKADDLRAQSYRLLANKQNSEENKSRAVEYADEVTAAIGVRRAAYDAARAEYWSALRAAIALRSNGVSQNVGGYVERVNSALSDASRSCGSSRADWAAAQKDLKEKLRTERLSFAEVLRDRKDFKAAVRAAIQTRNTAFDEAKSEFERTMQDIRAKYADLRS